VSSRSASALLDAALAVPFDPEEEDRRQLALARSATWDSGPVSPSVVDIAPEPAFVPDPLVQAADQQMQRTAEPAVPTGEYMEPPLPQADEDLPPVMPAPSADQRSQISNLKQGGGRRSASALLAEVLPETPAATAGGGDAAATRGTRRRSAAALLAEIPEDSGVLRRAGDVPIFIAHGITTGLKGLTDAFGADNAASQALAANQDFYQAQLSPEAQASQQRVAQIQAAAADQGVMAQLGAAGRAFAESPTAFVAQGVGTMAPTIALGAAGKAVGLGARGVQAVQTATGATMGGGIVKGEIYQAVEQAMLQAGRSPEEAAEAASTAQAYGGENLDQILAGYGLGALATAIGAERLAGRAIAGAAAPTGGVLRVAGRTALQEALPEAAQGGQEQLARNLAQQREDFNVPTMRGVVGAGALEGLAGLAIGGPAGVAAGAGARMAPQGTEQRTAGPAVPTGEAAAAAAAPATVRRVVVEADDVFGEATTAAVDEPVAAAAAGDERFASAPAAEQRPAEPAGPTGEDLFGEVEQRGETIVTPPPAEPAPQFAPDKQYNQKLPEITSVDVSRLSVRDSGEVRQLSPERVEEYRKYLNEPIEVSVFKRVEGRTTGELMISDGHHRVAAARALGITRLPARVRAINAFGSQINELLAEQQNQGTAITPVAGALPVEQLSDTDIEQGTVGVDVGTGQAVFRRTASPDAKSSRTNHQQVIAQALGSRRPVNAQAVDNYGMQLPQGYGRQGNLYVFQPEAAGSQASPAAAAQPAATPGLGARVQATAAGRAAKASKARARIKKMTSQSGAIDVSILEDIVEYGQTVYRAGMDLATWSAKMVKEFGQGVAQFLRQAFDRIVAAYRDSRFSDTTGAVNVVRGRRSAGGIRFDQITTEDPKHDGSRVGTAWQGKVRPTTQQTNDGIETVTQKELEKQMAMLTQFVEGVPLPKYITKFRDARQRMRAFIDFQKANLLALYDAFESLSADYVIRSTHWYDGARLLAEGIRDRYNVTVEQSAAILAVFSPMKDWFQNVAMGQRFADVMANYKNVKITKAEMRAAMKEMLDAAEDNKYIRKALSLIEGRSITDLLTDKSKEGRKLAAVAVRLMSTHVHGLTHDVLSPEGESLGIRKNLDGSNKKMVWQSYVFIQKAISVYEDGSLENISKVLGTEHKIRNFYNNIVAPTSPYGDATVDTHAVNAAVLYPMGNKGYLVGLNLGDAGVAGGGNSGLYWIFHQALREAAAERGVMPRQMQSITWEAIRGLFTDVRKRDKNFIATIKNIWKTSNDANTARSQIIELGITPPEWARVAGADSGSQGGVGEVGGPAADAAGSVRPGVRQGRQGGTAGTGVTAQRIRQKLTAEAGGIDASIIQDLADYGVRFYRAGMDLATWSGQMVREFGQAVGKYLREAFNRMLQAYRDSPYSDTTGAVGDVRPRQMKPRQMEEKAMRNEALAAETRARLGSEYLPISLNAQAEAAKEWINTNGLDAAKLRIAQLSGEDSVPTPLDFAIGIEAAGRLSAVGDHQGAADIVSTMSHRATGMGQTISTLAMMARLSPEGIVFYGENIIKRYINALPPEAQDRIRALQAEVARLKAELAKAKFDQGSEVIRSGKLGDEKIQDRIKRRQRAKVTADLGPAASGPEVTAETRARVISMNRAVRDVLLGDSTKAEATKAIEAILLEQGNLSAAEAAAMAKSIADAFFKLMRETRTRLTNEARTKALPTKARGFEKLLELLRSGKDVSDAEFTGNVAQLLGLPGMTPAMARELRALAQRYERATDPDVKMVLGQMMFEKAHEIIPVELFSKVRAFAYLAMLFSPKTWIKNFLGNQILWVAHIGRDAFISGIMDPAMALLTGKRTMSGAQFAKRSRALLTPIEDVRKGYLWNKQENPEANAWQNFMAGVNHLRVLSKLTSQNKFEIADVKNVGGRIFSSKFMRFFDTGLSIALGAGDRAFWMAEFRAKLAQMQAAAERNGEWSGQPTPEMVEAAMAEAAYAIFQNPNVLSQGLGELRKWTNFLSTGGRSKELGLGTNLLTFTQVPGSITLRGVIDWSPLGLIGALYRGMRGILYASSTGRMGAKFDQAAFNKEFTQALLGTGTLYVAGYYLYALGIVSASREDDDDLEAMRRASGLGQYRINVTALRRALLSGNWFQRQEGQDGDYIVPYDWAQPLAITFAAGAELAAQAERTSREQLKKGGVKPQGMAATIFKLSGTKSLEELPLLSGLSSFMKAWGYGGPVDAVANSVAGMPAMFMPQVVRQWMQFQDNMQRETQAGDSVQREFMKVLATVPWYSKTFPLKFDTMGQAIERYQYGGNNVFNVLLNPTVAREVKMNPVMQEISRLVDATGETGMAPKKVDRTATINGQKVELTNNQIAAYQYYLGNFTMAHFTWRMAAPVYARLPDELKAKMLTDDIKDIDAAVKSAVLGHDMRRLTRKQLFLRNALVNSPLGRSVPPR
jgi:hypothetical protein